MVVVASAQAPHLTQAVGSRFSNIPRRYSRLHPHSLTSRIVADSYPDSTFHGMDLSPIQPDWIPERVSFVVDDIEHDAGWVYPDDMFDYIHMRHTLPFIRDRTELWERIYQ